MQIATQVYFNQVINLHSDLDLLETNLTGPANYFWARLRNQSDVDLAHFSYN